MTAGLEDRVSRNEEPGLVWALVDASGLHLITTNVEGKRLSAEEDLAGLGFDLQVTPWDRPGGLDAVASDLTGRVRGSPTTVTGRAPRFRTRWPA